MRITKKDLAIERQYQEAVPDNLGNLHERMKAVVVRLVALQETLKRYPRKPGEWPLTHELNVAVYDLEGEVSCTKPADPPYSKRIVSASEYFGRS